MRPFLIIGSLAVGVILLVVSGYLPRRAGATGAASETASRHAARLEVKYADFEDEAGLIKHQPDQDMPQTPPKYAGRHPAPARAARTEDDPPAGPPKAPSGAGEPQPAQSDSPEPVADAGPDSTLWAGWNALTLDGSRSTGEGLHYAWKQADGPFELRIDDPSAAKTSASGLAQESMSWGDSEYEFQLTVTDARGRLSQNAVRYTVKTAPRLWIRPFPKRQLAFRDGYLLAHLEAWKTGRVGTGETFELRYPAALFIHQLGGEGEFEISASQAGDDHVYQITVFAREGQPTTWLEFFVDTPERVPAVVQLGVNWQ